MEVLTRWAICRRLVWMMCPVSPCEGLALAGVGACIVLGMWLDVVSVRMQGAIVNGVSAVCVSGELSAMHSRVLCFLLSRVAASVLIESRPVLLSVVESRVARDMASRVLLLAMSTAHVRETKTARLSRVVERGNKNISKVLVKTLTVAAPALCRLVVMLREVHLLFGPSYFALAAAAASVYAGYTYAMLRVRACCRRRINEAHNAVSRRIHESVTNAGLVSAYCGEGVETRRLAETMSVLWMLRLLDRGCVGMTNLGQRALFTGLFAQVVLQGLAEACAGTRSAGDLAMLFSLVLSVDALMRMLGTLAKDMGVWLTD